jgi:biotin carboxylase
LSRRLLVVGAGPTQEPAIRRACEMDLLVAAIDGNPNAPGLALAQHPLHISTLDISAVLEAARRFRPDGVMTVGSDRAVGVAAQVAHSLGLPGLHPEAAARTNSKLLMRQAFFAHSVPAPRFIAAQNLDAAQRAIAELGLPVVVKPVDNAAQRGVQCLANIEQLPRAFVEAQTYSTTDTVLVEEYVDGPEITVNSFSLADQMYPVLVADRITNPPPYLGIALAHAFPSTWAQPWWEQVVSVTSRALEAIGVDRGPGYTQLRIGRDGPKVMELGARIGGGRETELITLLGGPDWMTAQIKLALGEPLHPEDVDLPAAAKGQGGVVKFIFAPEGEVLAVQGVEHARQLPGVKHVEVRAEPGTRVPPMVNAEARQGYLIALGDTRDQALACAEAAAACIEFDVLPVTQEVGSDV